MKVHEFKDGFCIHCGGRGGGSDAMTCIERGPVEAPVRGTPERFDAHPWEIGQRLKEIRAEEDKALAGIIHGPCHACQENKRECTGACMSD